MSGEPVASGRGFQAGWGHPCTCPLIQKWGVRLACLLCPEGGAEALRFGLPWGPKAAPHVLEAVLVAFGGQLALRVPWSKQVTAGGSNAVAPAVRPGPQPASSSDRSLALGAGTSGVQGM